MQGDDSLQSYGVALWREAKLVFPLTGVYYKSESLNSSSKVLKALPEQHCVLMEDVISHLSPNTQASYSVLVIP